jgi:hypothetical protein
MKNSYFLLIIICGLIAGFCADAAEKNGAIVWSYNLEDLCDACFYQEVEDVERVLQNFVGDVNGISEQNRLTKKEQKMFPTTSLAYAAERGNFDMMAVLLKNGATPSAIALRMLASSVTGERFDTCFKLLMDHKVDLNGKIDSHGNRVLHFSLSENVKKLVRAGADVRIKNNRKDTPLYRLILGRAGSIHKSVKGLLVLGRAGSIYKSVKGLLEYAPIDEYYKAGEFVEGGRQFLKDTPCLAECNAIGERAQLLLVRGEMSKNNEQQLQSLVFWALHALDKNDKIFCKNSDNVFYCSLSGDLLEQGIKFLVKKKQVFEVIDDIKRHCPKGKLDRESRSNIMSFISTYAKTETDYRLEDRFSCYWGIEKEFLTGGQVKTVKEYITSRTEYLEKRISKQVGFPGLYKGQHRIRIKN